MREKKEPSISSSKRVVLQQAEGGLALVTEGRGAVGPVRVPWASETTTRYPIGIRRELIARAAGLKSGVRPSVWDLTAGLGRDAFTLAALGCSVLMVERSPLLYRLLCDALEQLRSRSERDQEIASRMSLWQGDALALLKERAHDLHKGEELDRPDVVYLDPMYPHRTKSAAVKKEMRVLRAVVGDDLDADSLLPYALKVARERVVVKRLRHAPPLNNTQPDVVFEGNHTRFDLYLSAQRS
jgi:16S rRNA (guanine1516-N2)-methyltransferase